MALSRNTKVREAYETGEYVHTDGTEGHFPDEISKTMKEKN